MDTDVSGNVIADNGSDVDNASGPAPTATNEALGTEVAPLGDTTDAGVDASWDVIGTGDFVVFTGTFVVTQDDVDLLQ